MKGHDLFKITLKRTQDGLETVVYMGANSMTDAVRDAPSTYGNERSYEVINIVKIGRVYV